MSEDALPKTKAELIFQIDREWSMLMDVVKWLSPDQMVRPDEGGWSPKDNLAHLTAWMNILLGYYFDKRLSHEVIGVDPQVTKSWDFDEMNALLFQRDRNKPVEEVLYDLNKAYNEVRARLDEMTYEDLLQPIFEDDPSRRPLINGVIGNTSAHFAEHRETIEKALKAS